MKVGFIGIGYMGRHMARNIRAAGHELTVFDIQKQAADEVISMGAVWAESPREVAEASEVIFTSLPRPENVEEVSLGEGGILSGASPGTTIFDVSTTDPDTIYRISERCKEKDVQILDAPVSGGTVGAEAGTLSVMVGGPHETYEKYSDLLNTIGNQKMYCGDLGSGAICKIVNNLVGMGVNAVLGEALSLGVKAGVGADMLFDAISKSSGNSQVLHMLSNTMFKGNFEPGFQVDLAAKDIGLATDMARRLKIPMEISNLIQQKYIHAQNRGWGKLDFPAVSRIQEERADVEIRSS